MSEQVPLPSNWIQTFSGRAVCPMAMSIESVSILDIAHALAMKCRFTGHCKQFYSVAQHSVLCSRIVPIEHAAWALMHDAAEYVLPDVARPIKGLLAGFRELEDSVMTVIARKYGLTMPIPAAVKVADETMLITEKRDLMSECELEWTSFRHVTPCEEVITPWLPEMAKANFLQRFAELF